MVNVVVENGELFGKDRAVLRNEQLVSLIKGWEQQRDVLMDEVAFRNGQVELLENLVKRAYEKVLDVNKEEKQKETDKIDARMDELKKEEADEEEEKRQKEARARHKKKEAAAKKRMEGSQKKSVKEKPTPKHPSDKIEDTQKRMRKKRS